jgi:hypothetical protein
MQWTRSLALRWSGCEAPPAQDVAWPGARCAARGRQWLRPALSLPLLVRWRLVRPRERPLAERRGSVKQRRGKGGCRRAKLGRGCRRERPPSVGHARGACQPPPVG